MDGRGGARAASQPHGARLDAAWPGGYWVHPLVPLLISCISYLFFLLLKRFYLFIFREGEGEKHQCVVASHVIPTGDLACNPGLCPDWESNR